MPTGCPPCRWCCTAASRCWRAGPGCGRIATELRSALRDVCRLDLRIHTNGVLLDEQFCELFAEHGVKVGISIDGDRAANDRHRRYADGRSSYDKVIRAIGLLRDRAIPDALRRAAVHDRRRQRPAGGLRGLNGPAAAADRFPAAARDLGSSAGPARRASDSEYADWLIAIFDRWLADGRPVQIRTFDSIISTLRGGPSYTEALGLGPASLAVIETDGSYEQVDSLKAAFDGAPETGMNVFDHAVDAVARHPGILARQQGIAALSQACQECPVVSSCGGRPVHPSIPGGQRLRQPVGLLRGPAQADLPRRAASCPGRTRGPWRAGVHSMSGLDFRALASGAGERCRREPAHRGSAQPAARPAGRGLPGGQWHRRTSPSSSQERPAGGLGRAGHSRP